MRTAGLAIGSDGYQRRVVIVASENSSSDDSGDLLIAISRWSSWLKSLKVICDEQVLYSIDYWDFPWRSRLQNLEIEASCCSCLEERCRRVFAILKFRIWGHVGSRIVLNRLHGWCWFPVDQSRHWSASCRSCRRCRLVEYPKLDLWWYHNVVALFH